MNRNYRMLAYVPRWGIAPRHHQQNVAEHSFYVVVYAAQLCDRMGIEGSDRLDVMDYALVHDVFEAWSSDIPGPAKRALLDPERTKNYHKVFAEEMDPYYRRSYERGIESVMDGYGVRRPIKDIVKVADLIDSVFYLQQELLMGNAFVTGLAERDMDRLRKATLGVLAGDALVQFWMDMDKAIHELGVAGAVLPVVDTDLPAPPFEDKAQHTGWAG